MTRKPRRDWAPCIIICTPYCKYVTKINTHRQQVSVSACSTLHLTSPSVNVIEPLRLSALVRQDSAIVVPGTGEQTKVTLLHVVQ